MHEDRARYPPPPGGMRRVLDRHVIVGHHIVGLYTFGFGQFSGHLEVQDIAGVVLYNVEGPGPAVHGFGSLEHLLWGRAGEDCPGAGCIQHTRTYVATVGRFVTRATAGDESYLVLYGRVGSHDDVVLGENPNQPRVRQLYS